MKRIITFLLICAILSGCKAGEETPESIKGMTFTDSTGRTVTVSEPQRIGICSGSLAECWLLSGGEIAAVTRDAVTERNMELPDGIIAIDAGREVFTGTPEEILKNGTLKKVFHVDVKRSEYQFAI